MCLNLFAIDLARRAVAEPAKAPAPKANPSLNSHISMLPTKNILCYTCSVHAQSIQPHVRVQIDWALPPNRIRQT